GRLRTAVRTGARRSLAASPAGPGGGRRGADRAADPGRVRDRIAVPAVLSAGGAADLRRALLRALEPPVRDGAGGGADGAAVPVRGGAHAARTDGVGGGHRGAGCDRVRRTVDGGGLRVHARHHPDVRAAGAAGLGGPATTM